MKPYAIFICGALAASVPWVFVCAWVFDRLDEARKQAAINRWRGWS